MVDPAISKSQHDSANGDHLNGPPIISQKGQPQTQHLTGALEGRPWEGGAKQTISNVLGTSEQGATKRQPTHSGICCEFSHNCTTCPLLQN